MKRKKRRVVIHPACLPAVLFLCLMGYGRQLPEVLFFVTLHELSHIGAARAFGVRLGRLTLTPVGQRASLPGLCALPLWKRLLVYGAGPAVSLVLGLFSPFSLAVGCFNLLPVLPLDGGNLLYALLIHTLGDLKGGRLLEGLGKGLSVFLMGMGFVQAVLFPGNLSLLLIGFYLWRANRGLSEALRLRYYQNLFAGNAGKRPLRTIFLKGEEPVGRTLKGLSSDFEYLFCFPRDGALQTRTQAELIRIYFEKGAEISVSDT